MKVSKKSQGHVTDLLFTLALFCVFAASSLMVVLIGANVYKNTVQGMTDNFNMRTSLTYVSEKMRQNDTTSAVHLDSLEGVRALVMEQTYNDAVYQTWIYHHDGKLKEIFTKKENGVKLADGQNIMEISSFTVEELDGLYRLTAVNESGQTAQTAVSLRCN